MFKKIVILIFVIIVIGVVFFLFSGDIIRLFTKNAQQDVSIQKKAQEIFVKNNLENNESEESPGSSQEDDKSPNIVSSDDCELECSSYSADDYKKSCVEECNLKVSKEDKDCSKLSGNEHDACWKKEAVKENNFELCNNIQDSNKKKACQDRLIEDLLESGESL